MQRYDLRHLKDDFYGRMGELIESGLKDGEVGIFLFEVGDFSSIQKSADFVRDMGHELMNSLKFNEVDWTLVMKKVSSADVAKRKAEAEEAVRIAEEKRIEAEKIAEEKAKADAEKKAKDEAEKAEADSNADAEKVASSENKAPSNTTPVAKKKAK